MTVAMDETVNAEDILTRSLRGFLAPGVAVRQLRR
jgi:hypothetical protein